MTALSRIPITRPVLGEAEQHGVAQVLASGWLAMGARTADFEAAFADRIGAKHAVAVSSGTTALQLALLASGIGPGDEVVVPSLSFVASANVVLHVGARPLLVDVDPLTGNINPAAAEAAIGPHTKALMPVHQLGLPAALAELRALAERHGLLLLEDAACALGASYGGVAIGGGRACCFSFHPRKVITTGEGGMVCTDDPELADRVRLLRNQGISLPASARHHSTELRFEEIPVVGYNARLTDLQAAIGLAQLDRLPDLLAARRRLAQRYTTALAGLADRVRTPVEPPEMRHSYQSYMVLLEEPYCRRALMQHLHERGIDTRRGVTAIHRTLAYRELFPSLSLPVSERFARRGLMLPLYPQLTDEEQGRVVEALVEGLC